MKTLYPLVCHYLSALDTPRKTLRTLGKRLVVVCDERGEAVCRVSRSSLRVLAELDGAPCAIHLPLRDALRPWKGDRYEAELGVGAEYFDLWVEAPWVVRTPENIEEDPTAFSSEGLHVVGGGGGWGFADATGRMVVEAQYDRVEPFCEGRAVVEQDGLCGLIDRDGCLVIPLIYDELSYDGSHYCYVDQMGQSGVVDRTGRVVVEPEWDWVSEFAQGLLLVERGGKYGYVDTMGRIAIEPSYDNASSFDLHGYASVVKNGAKYLIDKDQNRV